MVIGLAAAPRIFTQICKPILAYLRGNHKIVCSLYIDDMLVINRNKQALVKGLGIIAKLFERLGFSVNSEKSVFQPTQIIKHLGVLINSQDLTLSMPDSKIVDIKNKSKR